MDTIIIGIDMGGTKTACVAAGSDGVVFSEIRSDGKNLKTSGVEAVGCVIVDLAARTRVTVSTADNFDASRVNEHIHISAGVAGAGLATDREALKAYLETEIENCSVRIFPDTSVAIEGAFDGNAGMLCITGTGSNVCARDSRGAYYHAGGWGPQLGDPASAVQLGMDALRALIKCGVASDEVKQSQLLSGLVDDHGLQSRENILACVYDSDGSISPPMLARTVLTAYSERDSYAVSIVENGVRDFVQQIEKCCHALSHLDSSNKRYVHMGGLSADATFAAFFSNQMAIRFPDWRRMAPIHSPERGALDLGLRFVLES